MNTRRQSLAVILALLALQAGLRADTQVVYYSPAFSQLSDQRFGTGDDGAAVEYSGSKREDLCVAVHVSKLPVIAGGDVMGGVVFGLRGNGYSAHKQSAIESGGDIDDGGVDVGNGFIDHGGLKKPFLKPYLTVGGDHVGSGILLPGHSKF